MSLRFVVPDHGSRGIRDQLSREIIGNLKAAGLGIASGTYQIVGVPRLQVAVSAEGTGTAGPLAAAPPA
jgi:hypothetical protein